VDCSGRKDSQRFSFFFWQVWVLTSAMHFFWPVCSDMVLSFFGFVTVDRKWPSEKERKQARPRFFIWWTGFLRFRAWTCFGLEGNIFRGL